MSDKAKLKAEDNPVTVRADTDYRKIPRGEAREAGFPVATAAEYRVYLTEDAYRRMKEHASTSNEVELGGVLLGEVFHDKDGYFLRISAVIEGEGANNYGAQVTFTHQTWSHINKVKDAKYPDLRIVGWYHSHPGFGVFLSQMDTFIQDNFFSQPYQVAVVIETRKHVEGCFAWVDGKPTALKRYWVGDREVALESGRAEDFVGRGVCDGKSEVEDAGTAAAAADAGGSGWRVSAWAVVIALVLGLLLGRLMGWFGAHRELQGYESEIYSLIEIAALGDKMDSDLKQIELQLKDAAGAAGDGASKEKAAALAAQVALLRDWYEQPRSQYRRTLQNLTSVKQGLYSRIAGSEQRITTVEDMLAQLYLIQVMQIVAASGSADGAALKPEERMFVKTYLDIVLRMRPVLKDQIRAMMPDLMKTMYPEGGKP